MNRRRRHRVATGFPHETLDVVVRRMAEKEGLDKIYGIAVVLDDQDKVLGVLTDGDVRRAYASEVDFTRPVSDVMIPDPIVVRNDEEPRDIAGRVSSQIANRDRLSAPMVSHIVVVDDQGRLEDVIDVVDLLARSGSSSENVAVYGLGYIGLPLAVTLANVGHRVFGVDLDPQVREKIKRGNASLHEPGLQDMLQLVLEDGSLSIHDEIGDPSCNVHIIAVGTPVGPDGTIDESGVLKAADSVKRVLKSEDLVQLRSTVPVGFTRSRFLARLRSDTDLIPGRDFYVSFAPERTVEGEALKELRSLPQIVGGCSTRCLEKAATFWSSVTHTIVRVESLEAAELIKLANNTYRDLIFGFANELAVVCDRFNLDAFEVIEAANEGYPRDRIPSPSPGVGGYCLTKDPVIYDESANGGANGRTLGYYSRAANEQAAGYPRLVLERWLAAGGKELGRTSVLCLGLAFKGYPETNDLRGSTALGFAQWLKERVGSLLVWDAVVGAEVLDKHGLRPSSDVQQALQDVDAVFLLNNHPAHSILGIPRVLSRRDAPRLVFDGWHQLDREELERISGVTYATMGYVTGPGAG